MSDEDKVSINGQQLSVGEVMTLRGALECFQRMLVNEGLGDDASGVRITEGYLKNISLIREKISTD